MKYSNLIFAFILLFAFTSCSTTKFSYREAQIPDSDLLVMPTVVDVNVDMEKKVEGASAKLRGVNNAISAAYFTAIENSGADIIIDPVYTVQTGSRFLIFGGKSTATVTGYYGKYENARKLSESLPEFTSLDTTDLKKAHLMLKGFDGSTSPSNPQKTFGKGVSY